LTHLRTVFIRNIKLMANLVDFSQYVAAAHCVAVATADVAAVSGVAVAAAAAVAFV